jgi:hypothetical protein
LKSIVVVVLASIMVASVLLPTVVQGSQYSGSSVQVPIIHISTLGFGDKKFVLEEHFKFSPEKLYKHRGYDYITVSYHNQFKSPLNDSIKMNFSVTISRHSSTVVFPAPSGELSIQGQAGSSYYAQMSVSGRTSFKYVTVAENIYSNHIGMGHANGDSSIRVLNETSLYNITLIDQNNSFNVYLPGYVSVNGNLSQAYVALSQGIGEYFVLYSFPVSDGNFSFTFNQLVSSSINLNDYLMQEYDVSGFENALADNLVSNAISLIMGGLIFAALFLGLFLYYKKK